MITYPEIALQLTMKAMETGLIAPKPTNFCKSEDPFAESTNDCVKRVNDFYQETMRRLQEDED